MIQVIHRALNILEYVAKHKERACSLTEIAASLELNQPTCANILKTLVDANYLEHLGRKKGYRLGPMVYQLTGDLSYNQNLLQVAKPEMEKLTDKLNESCILGIIRNQKRFILHTVNSDQDLQVRSKSERDIYETASGRMLLAFLPEKERDALTASIGLPKPEIWKGIKTKALLDAAFQKIREDRLVITLSPSHIVGLAVPIEKNGTVIASLSIFLPESRYNRKGNAKVVTEALIEVGNKINRAMSL
ncbi:IclR family transcriptional regulator [Parapedobacter indicus]|uniref:Transcriptional regulator, IclR family n=1 Tax=Parapedobacter indicus TaxID=1477437 RepID=A0A1I3HIY0_9SPHI|nr:IclR family transcriptional regulator [Parapedobacter indicus]PPL03059.1 IclR family transcriptional regulator [Parapedobacter indicus]SFI35694.1 transcriptional regulator, IclR family [Parapedobacter indicus]